MDDEEDLRSAELLLSEIEMLTSTIRAMKGRCDPGNVPSSFASHISDSEESVTVADRAIEAGKDLVDANSDAVNSDFPDSPGHIEGTTCKSIDRLMDYRKVTMEMQLQQAELNLVQKELSLTFLIESLKSRFLAEIEELSRESESLQVQSSGIQDRIRESSEAELKTEEEIGKLNETLRMICAACLPEAVSAARNRKEELVAQINEMRSKLAEVSCRRKIVEESLQADGEKYNSLQLSVSKEQTRLSHLLNDTDVATRELTELNGKLRQMEKAKSERTSEIHEIEFKTKSVVHQIECGKAHVESLNAEREILERELRVKNVQFHKDSISLEKVGNEIHDLEMKLEIKEVEVKELEETYLKAQKENERLVSLAEQVIESDIISEKKDLLAKLESELAQGLSARQRLVRLLGSVSSSVAGLRLVKERKNAELKKVCDELILAEIEGKKLSSEIVAKEFMLQNLKDLMHALHTQRGALMIGIQRDKDEGLLVQEKQLGSQKCAEALEKELCVKKKLIDDCCDRIRLAGKEHQLGYERKRELYLEAERVSRKIEINVNEIDKCKFWILHAERTKAGLISKHVQLERLVESLRREHILLDNELTKVKAEFHFFCCGKERVENRLLHFEKTSRFKKLELTDSEREILIILKQIPKLSFLKENSEKCDSELKLLKAKRAEIEENFMQTTQGLAGKVDEWDLVGEKIASVKVRLQSRKARIIENEFIGEELDREMESLRVQAKENAELMVQLNVVKGKMNRQSRKAIASISELGAVESRCKLISEELERGRGRLIACRANISQNLAPCAEAEEELIRQIRREKIKGVTVTVSSKIDLDGGLAVISPTLWDSPTFSEFS